MFPSPHSSFAALGASPLLCESQYQRLTEETRDGGVFTRKQRYLGAFEQILHSADGTDTDWDLKYTKIYIGGYGVYTYDHRAPSTATTPITRHWFHSDHLGSLIGITDSTGTLVEEYAYDAWGNRLDPTDWAGDPTSFNTDLTDRGFTSHEMMDAVGLVNMNGRIYDPALGRFLSADPYVQFPENFQNYNRYTYVNNNPVSFNDPSGHYLSILTGIIGGVAGWGATTLIVAVSVAAAVQTFVRGGSLTEALKAGIFTALAAWVGGEIGSIFDGTKEFIIAASKGTVNWGVEIARAAAHGITQGGFAELQGGDFGSYFLSSFTGSISGSAMLTGAGQKYFGSVRNPEKIAHRTIASAIVGGTTSELSGGKFSNGALTAAVVHLFNAEEILVDEEVTIGQLQDATTGETWEQIQIRRARTSWQRIKTIEQRFPQAELIPDKGTFLQTIELEVKVLSFGLLGHLKGVRTRDLYGFYKSEFVREYGFYMNPKTGNYLTILELEYYERTLIGTKIRVNSLHRPDYNHALKLPPHGGTHQFALKPEHIPGYSYKYGHRYFNQL